MKTHPTRYAKYWKVTIDHFDEDGFHGTTTYIAEARSMQEMFEHMSESALRDANPDVQQILIAIERPRLS